MIRGCFLRALVLHPGALAVIRIKTIFALLALALQFSRAAYSAETSFTEMTYTYKTVEPCSLQAIVYRPRDAVIRPVVFWIHGGALIGGYRGDLAAEQLQRYLAAGFVVVSIDYRLAPETKLPHIREDVRDAYEWVRAKGPGLFHIDPSRIAVVGHSAGGYLALTSGYFFQPPPRAIVSFYGYGDIIGKWYSQPDPFYLKQPAVSRQAALDAVRGGFACGSNPPGRRWQFYIYCRQHGLWPQEVAGYDPHSNPDAFRPLCPLRNITGSYPPTLLLHGDKDTDVPFQQSEEMFMELKRHGVECEFIRVQGGSHAFDEAGLQSPQVSADFDRVIEFLKKHLD